MPIRNTVKRWGAVSQLFHWVIVALVITQFVLANIADGLPNDMRKLAVLANHKSVGMTILILAVLRIAWRHSGPRPPLPGTLKAWELVLARVSHLALYILLFAVPLSGWLMSSARNFPVSWFGYFQFPDLISPSEAAFERAHETHEILAFTLGAVAILHLLAALKHHFIYKDDVLKRMLPFTRTD
jgi:cytochrome b561